MAEQVVTGVAHIITKFNPFKYSILDYDNNFTGSTFGFMGDTIPITVVSIAPVNPPAGNVSLIVQVTAGVVTFWVWDGAAWRSK